MTGNHCTSDLVTVSFILVSIKQQLLATVAYLCKPIVPQNQSNFCAIKIDLSYDR